MEKKLKLLILLTVMYFNGGLSVGSRIDQAGPLRAIRRGKMRADHDEKSWTVVKSLGGNEGGVLDVGKMEDDLIKGGLPGQPSRVMFKQYSGYVSVDKSNGRSLFYYFAEAVTNPSSSPLILWLNGGPGCSSFGVGAMAEIGPFRVKADGKTLYLRQHSWNKVANILFLESPAGVGFSYSNTTSDYIISGDTRTAQDTYIFLRNWFKRFPQYKSRDFYLMGESYSGFYIPELANYIMKRNMEEDSSSKITLKGIMIGNGIMNDVTDERGMHDYLWSHALISDETYRGLIEHCNNSSSPKCDDYEKRVGIEAGNIDLYSIYSPICLPNSSRSSKNLKGGGGRFDPCEENYVAMYLNLPQVQAALHANTTKLPYAWDFCSDKIHSWKDKPTTMFPIYRSLIASGLQILLYSGDMDAVVPVTSTRYSLDAFNVKVIKPWHSWSDHDDHTTEADGYKVVYDGLTFMTVRGAGHEVPRVQPRRALSLLKIFLQGK